MVYGGRKHTPRRILVRNQNWGEPIAKIDKDPYGKPEDEKSEGKIEGVIVIWSNLPKKID